MGQGRTDNFSHCLAKSGAWRLAQLTFGEYPTCGAVIIDNCIVLVETCALLAAFLYFFDLFTDVSVSGP